MQRLSVRLARVGFVALTTVGLYAGVARAEAFRLSTEFGPVRLEINHTQRSVFGSYPNSDGRIFAEVSGARGIIGTWVQPRGEHPCTTLVHGSANWGWLNFSRLHHGAIRGVWGYCDEPMTHPWDGAVD